jgi:hypothetical protein
MILSWNCIVSSEIVIRCRNWIVCSELAFAAELCVLQRICDSLLNFSCLQRIHDSLSKLCCLQRNYDSLPKLSCLQRIIIRCRIVCSEGKFMIHGRSGIVCNEFVIHYRNWLSAAISIRCQIVCSAVNLWFAAEVVLCAMNLWFTIKVVLSAAKLWFAVEIELSEAN